MSELILLIDIDDSDPRAVTAAALAMVRAGLAEVVPGPWEWIRRYGPLEEVPGPPGGYFGKVGVTRDGDLTGWADSTLLAEGVEEWVTRALDPWPDYLNLELERLDGNGRFYEFEDEGKGHVLSMSVHASEDPAQVQLECEFSLEACEAAAPAGGPSVPRRVIEPLVRVCEAADVSFAYIGDDYGGNLGETALDGALWRTKERSVAEARRFLRGYSWVTVLPRELAAKLGGGEALAASGAFHAVRTFPSGAVLVQATEEFTDYGPDQVRAVFEALRKALPPGEPKFDVFDVEAGKTRRLIPEDAAPDVGSDSGARADVVEEPTTGVPVAAARLEGPVEARRRALPRPRQGLFVVVDVYDRDPDRVKTAAFQWMRDGLAGVVPGPWGWLRRHGSLSLEDDYVQGGRGGYLGSVTVRRRTETLGGVDLGEGAEEWMSREIAGWPEHLDVYVYRVDEGWPVEYGIDADDEVVIEKVPGPLLMHLWVEGMGEPQRAQLVCRLPLADDREWAASGGSGGVSLPERLVGLVTGAIAAADVAYAEISDGHGTFIGWTELDAALQRDKYDSIAEAHRYLRGYAWLTVLPAELAARLGGAAALSESGAFHAVREFPSGAVLLQATEQFADYGPDQATGVFGVLNPVLPPNEPGRIDADIPRIKTRRIVL